MNKKTILFKSMKAVDKYEAYEKFHKKDIAFIVGCEEKSLSAVFNLMKKRGEIKSEKDAESKKLFYYKVKSISFEYEQPNEFVKDKDIKKESLLNKFLYGTLTKHEGIS